MKMLERIHSLVFDECRLDAARPLVLGVSGGADSLCLMVTLQQLGFPLIVAHYDHALRPDSAEDAQFVAELAASRGLTCLVERGDVASLAARERLSIEEAARNARYAFLFGCARQVGAQAVATGHTADDQVETVLMHLLRGSGMAGLKGMLPASLNEGWDAQIPLVRPLLAVWREETEACCAEAGLQPRMDASNRDTRFFRNRLRYDLVPYLQDFNPRIKEVLLRTAAVLAGDEDALSLAVVATWEQVCAVQSTQRVDLRLPELLDLPLGLRRRVMRKAVEALRPGLRDLDFETVERALAFAASPPRSRRAELALGVWLTRRGELLLLSDGALMPGQGTVPQLAGWGELSVGLPGSTDLGAGWKLDAEFLPPPADVRAAGRWETWLDADALALPLVVRPAEVGERFQPLGLDGRSQKLSDFWVNAGLPQEQRPAWPLVCDAQQVVWVTGFRPDHRCRVTPATKRCVHLVLHPPDVP